MSSNEDTSRRRMSNLDWIRCFAVIEFDVKEGHVVKQIFPSDAKLSEDEMDMKNLSFPSSQIVGDSVFSFRVRINRSVPYLSSTPREYRYRNGFSFFRCKKDPMAPRGYNQSSIVLLSEWPLFGFFDRVIRIVGRAYFSYGEIVLKQVVDTIRSSWEILRFGQVMKLPLLGEVLTVSVPEIDSISSAFAVHCDLDKRPDGNVSRIRAPRSRKRQVSRSVKDSSSIFDGFRVYDSLFGAVALSWELWDIIVTGEPLMVFAKSPELCSGAVVSLVSLCETERFVFGVDVLPYLTTHCKDARRILEAHDRCQPCPPVIMGVTNPYFLKALPRWPNVLFLGHARLDLDRETFRANLKRIAPRSAIERYVPASVMSCGESARPMLIRRRVSSQEPDRDVMRRLVRPSKLSLTATAVSVCARSSSINGAILRRHFSDKTRTFLNAFERTFLNTATGRDALDSRSLSFDRSELLREIQKSSSSGKKSDDALRRFASGPNLFPWLARFFRRVAEQPRGVNSDSVSGIYITNGS